MRLTLGHIRNSTRIPRILGMATTDPRIKELVNEAIERLTNYPQLWDTLVVRYRFCCNNACITWPRHVDTILALQICDTPGTVLNQWYEFIGDGYGGLSTDIAIGRALVDRGERCTFDDIDGTNKKLRVVSDQAEAASAKLRVLGYDENGNWIRCQDSAGNWYDGEDIAISTTPTNSTKFFTAITGIIKPVTYNVVRLYEYDNDAGTYSKALGYYEPDEELPSYRSSLIPGLTTLPKCDGQTDSCDKYTITALVRLAYMPVTNDNDFLLINNVPVLKDMILSIIKRENNLLQESAQLEALAVKQLSDQLRRRQHTEASQKVVRTNNSQLINAGVDNVVG